MIDDELIAKSLMVLINYYKNKTMIKKWDLKSKDIDLWYQSGVGFHNIKDPNCPYCPVELERAKAIIKMSFRAITQQKIYPPSQLVPKEQYWALLISCAWVYDNRYYVDDPEKYFEEIRTIHKKLKSDSSVDFVNARATAKAKGKDPDDIREKDYYFRQCTTVHVSPNRKNLTKKLYDSLNSSSLKSIRLKQSLAAK